MTDTELQLIADSVREYMDEKIRAVRDPLLREIETLQEQLREFEPAAVDMAAIRSMIDDSVLVAVEALPKPKDGVDGKDGAPGRDGTPGKDGESIKGESGQNGKDGADVDMVAVRGMVTEMFAGYPIPKDGVDGAPGRDGIDGKDGESIKGDVGERGEAGIPGINGKDGAPGRDALQIEILSAIDETRSFPRGTFARYRNGLIRSFRDTDPITGELEKSGWEVIVSGPIFGIVQKDDLRSFDVIATETGGKEIVRTFTMPVVLDRGVFKDGGDYVRGDGVTWDGSFWICQVEFTKAKPGTSGDWRLAVKRGGEGKPGKPEPPKPQSGPIKL